MADTTDIIRCVSVRSFAEELTGLYDVFQAISRESYIDDDKVQAFNFKLIEIIGKAQTIEMELINSKYYGTTGETKKGDSL